MYTPDEAELEDLDFYADYLLKEHREGLLAFCFEGDLPEDDLREALLRSFEAVRELTLGAVSWDAGAGSTSSPSLTIRLVSMTPNGRSAPATCAPSSVSLAHVPAGEIDATRPSGHESSRSSNATGSMTRRSRSSAAVST